MSWRLVTALAVTAISFGTQALASSALPLRVGITESPPRRTFEGGVARGVDVEVFRELARRLGTRADFVSCPLKRCFHMARTGDLDIIPGLIKTPDRSKVLIFAEPKVDWEVKFVVYVRRDQQERIESYEDLRKLTIGTVAGAKYFKRFDDDVKMRKEPSPDRHTNFRKLAKGRFDAVIDVETRADHFVEKYALTSDVFKTPFRWVEIRLVHYFTVAKPSPWLLELPKLQDAWGKMIADGTFQRLVANGTL